MLPIQKLGPILYYIIYLKWPTLKIRILHIILDKVHRNAFGKYPLIYLRSKYICMTFMNI